MKTSRAKSSPHMRPKAGSQTIRTGHSPEAMKRAIMDNLNFIQGRVPLTATRNDWYMALAYTVRDRILHRWMQTIETYMRSKEKSVNT